MDHSAHEPGTVADCPECRELSYEPGWFKALRIERVEKRDHTEVLVPEVGERIMEVVVSEHPPGAEVVVPELEATRPPDPVDP